LVAQGLAYIAFAARRPALFRLMFAGRDTACIRGGIGGLQLGLQPAKTLLGHRAEQRRLVGEVAVRVESDRTDLRRVLVREAMALLGDGTAEISLRSVAT
jgi:hypothetical protein